MATIKVTDSLSGELISANPQASAGFARYLKGPAAPLLAGTDFVQQFKRELPLVSPGQSGFALQWSSDIPVGTDGVALKVSAGADALIGVFNRAGMRLVDDAFVGPPLTVPAGRAFVSFLFRPALVAGTSSHSGRAAFGFEAASESEWRFYQPFDLMGPPLTLGDACRQLFETLVIPGDVADLKALATRPDGTMSIVSGRGALTINCTANVVSAVNPLASVDTLAKVGSLNLSAGVSAKVGVRATLSGEFQIRAQAAGAGKILIGYHKMAGRDVGVTLDASAGPGLSLGGRDILTLLFGEPPAPGQSIEESLVAAGVSAGQLKTITKALSAGLSRKLELEIGASFSALTQQDAAFLYEIDVAALDPVGAAALEKALAGDLGDLTQLDDALPAHGIRMIQSRTVHLRRREVKWRLNVIGLVNVLSVSELATKATVVHDTESGELLMTDAATGQKVKAITSRKELRRLLYQSLMLSVTYKAAGVDANTGVTAAQSFFKIDDDVNRHEMADYLDAVAAVGLISEADVEAHLGAVDDFARGSLLIDVEYDQAACERMFLDGQGQARDREFYEDVGKLALLALVQADDADAYRRLPLTSHTLWKDMIDAAPDFGTVLPPPITSGSADAQKLRVAIVAADYFMIRWWAAAMATASTRLAAMRAFLSGPPAVVPSDTDAAFTNRRKDLSHAMVEVIQKSPATFGGDPWGLVALWYASQRSVSPTAVVVSPRLTLFLP